MKHRLLTAVLGSAGLGIAAAAVIQFPSLAGAHTNAVTGISACADSGTYTVTWTVKNNQANLAETATLTSTGGGTLSASSIAIAQGSTAQVTQSGIPATAATATLTAVGTWANGETTTAYNSVALSGTCTIKATPAAPTIAQSSCTGPGQATQAIYAIPTTAGVDYLVSGSITPAGPHAIAQGASVVVTAAAQPGYTLQGTATWTLTATPIDCAEPVTPAAPALSQPACTAPGTAADATYTIPSSNGIVYRVGDSKTSAGTYPLAPGATVIVHAEALPGYTLVGTDEWTVTAQVINCTVPAAPATPTYATQQCVYPSYTVTPATVTIPSTPGVVYSVDGTVTAAGTRPVAVGSHVVTAAPIAGYELLGYPVSGWPTTIAAVPCEVSVLAAPPVARPSLANTGTAAASLTVLGVSVLLIGGALVGMTTRRRRTES